MLIAERIVSVVQTFPAQGAQMPILMAIMQMMLHQTSNQKIETPVAMMFQTLTSLRPKLVQATVMTRTILPVRVRGNILTLLWTRQVQTVMSMMSMKASITDNSLESF